MEAWTELKVWTKSRSSILIKPSDGHSKTVQEKERHMYVLLHAVIESQRFRACQTIGQQTHREDEHCKISSQDQ